MFDDEFWGRMFRGGDAPDDVLDDIKCDLCGSLEPDHKCRGYAYKSHMRCVVCDKKMEHTFRGLSVHKCNFHPRTKQKKSLSLSDRIAVGFAWMEEFHD